MELTANTDFLHHRLERGRLIAVIATIVLNVLAVAAFTQLPWSNW